MQELVPRRQTVDGEPVSAVDQRGAQRTVIVDGQVLMPGGGWSATSILIEGARIVDVSAHIPTREARVIDARSRWVIPGLIDAHAHLCFSMDSPEDEGNYQRLLRAARNASINLLAGITTLRDLGAMEALNIELAKAIDAGIIPGPRLIPCGKFITMTGGHVHYWGREADGESEVRKAVREQLKAGAKVVKLMASGGVADSRESPDVPELSEQEMAAAVVEARRAGVKVAAHAHGENSMIAALRAGVDTLEHASFLTPRVVDLLLEKQAAVVPTFAVYRSIADSARLPHAQREAARRVLEAKAQGFVAAIRRGVRYGVGTDAGSFFPPGAMVLEMKCMAETGLTNREILLAATAGNADLLGLANQLGTLEAGKLADVVILNSDPLAALDALKQIHCVFKDGEQRNIIAAEAPPSR